MTFYLAFFNTLTIRFTNKTSYAEESVDFNSHSHDHIQIIYNFGKSAAWLTELIGTKVISSTRYVDITKHVEFILYN